MRESNERRRPVAASISAATPRGYVNQLGGVAVIALHPSRAKKPPFDEHLYYERHRIENLFARLKAFRRIATRYEKRYASFRHALPRPHPHLA